MKLKVFLLIAHGFWRRKSVTNAKTIFPDTTWNGNDSSMHILVHDKLVVFWIFIRFQLRQSNHVQYGDPQVSNRVNLSACA